ncbi:MAG: Late competence development protein ComFB [Firmicutes bacterium]|nr:Late competence development protein ComFB [Bacillota bacterium]
MELKNSMEAVVRQALDELLDDYSEICKCERCRYDIMALALNVLPPKYVVSDRGAVLTRLSGLEQQFKVNVVCAVTNAIDIVKSKPHHRD